MPARDAIPLSRRGRYRVEDGKVCIDLTLRHPKQLFDARDAAPFRERDLDDDAVEWLTASVEELRFNEPFKIVIAFLEPPGGEMDAEGVRQAIQAHFDYEIDLLRRKLSRLFRQGYLFLALGLGMLMVCLYAASLVERRAAPDLKPFLGVGLTISGWVALWRPIEVFLFDWWPFAQQMRLMKRIRNAEIEVRWGG